MKDIPVRHITQEEKDFSSNGFNIRELSKVLAGKDMDHHIHRHDFYFILAIEQGRGWHEIDFVRYEVSDHSIFIIRPGQVHQLKLSVGSTGYIVEFDNSFYHPQDKLTRQRLVKAGSKDFCVLEAERFFRLSKILAYMLEEYQRREEGYIAVIKANLDIFFVEFMRQHRRHESGNKPEGDYTQTRLEEFLNLVDANIATHKQVAQYAGLLNLSTYQLNAITKTSLGKSASTVINEQILLEAKRYLLATSNQVKEIADLLGYEDISYFIRFFKKHTGYSPEVFRKNFK
ncbi:helix-turn-helix domain-containing protein [Chitinophaga sp. G-6-1-13]|uniref:Helix-turn-helix domain-containing protein n=1 Tax=Chitinophaga fulva TaxID=2728842 RepID=A0A848GV54_9BACT|nr:helix-turn-helix transcriptional regulator [Chitinophaga fulva]NML39598.1 helix-turn-helix domain-containing protein [Chitinophaga fulva]